MGGCEKGVCMGGRGATAGASLRQSCECAAVGGCEKGVCLGGGGFWGVSVGVGGGGDGWVWVGGWMGVVVLVVVGEGGQTAAKDSCESCTHVAA